MDTNNNLSSDGSPNGVAAHKKRRLSGNAERAPVLKRKKKGAAGSSSTYHVCLSLPPFSASAAPLCWTTSCSCHAGSSGFRHDAPPPVPSGVAALEWHEPVALVRCSKCGKEDRASVKGAWCSKTGLLAYSDVASPEHEVLPGPGDRSYVYDCAKCSGTGSSVLTHLPKTWCARWFRKRSVFSCTYGLALSLGPRLP